MARRVNSSTRRPANSRTLAAAALLFVAMAAILVVVLIADNVKTHGGAQLPDPPANQSPGLPPPSVDIDAVVATGDGHDWLKMSDLDRLRAGEECARRTGRHSAIIFRDFIQTFYSKAEAENRELLNRDIAELAAVAAALELAE